MVKWLLKNVFTTSFNGYTYANVEKLQIDMFYKLAEIGVEVIDEPGCMVLKNKNTGLVFGKLRELAGQNHSLALMETVKEFKKIEKEDYSHIKFTEKTGSFFYVYHKPIYHTYSKTKFYDFTKIKLVTPKFQFELTRDKVNDIDVVEIFKLVTTLVLYISDKERRIIESAISEEF